MAILYCVQYRLSDLYRKAFWPFSFAKACKIGLLDTRKLHKVLWCFFFIVNTTSTWSKCKWKSNLGLVRVKVPGEDGTSQKMAWFPIGILLPEIPVPFFLQNFFNLSLLPDSVFCGQFLVTATDLCKLRVDKNPGRNLPVPSFTYHLPWTAVITVSSMLMKKQPALSRSDSKAGSEFCCMKSMAN